LRVQQRPSALAPNIRDHYETDKKETEEKIHAYMKEHVLDGCEPPTPDQVDNYSRHLMHEAIRRLDDPSALLKHRLAFFNEGGHAFFLVLGGEQGVELATLEAGAF
jgi:hypothetical protein